MTEATEKFIIEPAVSNDMAKDSDLVRKVEKFLEEHKINNYKIAYDRGIDLDGHPHFDVELTSLRALERLSKETKIPLKKDRYNFKEILEIESGDYNLDIYKRMKIPVAG